MTNEPSPRPWRVDGIDISDANGEPITPLYFNERDEANAALIVKAVNERERLRDIVRRLAEQLHDAVKLTPYDAIARDLLREARAAIVEDAP